MAETLKREVAGQQQEQESASQGVQVAPDQAQVVSDPPEESTGEEQHEQPGGIHAQPRQAELARQQVGEQGRLVAPHQAVQRETAQQQQGFDQVDPFVEVHLEGLAEGVEEIHPAEQAQRQAEVPGE